MMDWFKFWGQEFNYNDEVIRFNQKTDDHAMDEEYNPLIQDPAGRKFKLVDPFIIQKNVTKRINRRVLDHLIKECQNGLALLEAGSSLSSLISPLDESPLIDKSKGRKKKNNKKRGRN